MRYNDPFDSQWDPMWNLRTPKALQVTRQLMTKAIEDPNSWPEDTDPEFKTGLLDARTGIYDLPLASREGAIRELVDDVADSHELHEKINARLLDLRRRLRVLCLSATPERVSMWSHYADQHRGVVLTFDSSMLENGLKRPFQEVLYEDSPPIIFDLETWSRSIIFGLPMPEFPDDPNVWSRTKSPEWSDEEEWRLTTIAGQGTLGDYADYDLPRNALVGITFGCRTDMVVARELAALALPFGEQVKLYQLYMPVGSFKLARRDLSFSDDL
ncbi:MAG: DUF2971 domain-containing protein [Phycisphaerales bacterium]